MRFAAILFGAICLAPALVAQQRPAITGVAFMRLYSSDAAASQAFYGGTLGLARVEHAGEVVYPVNSLQWVEVIPHAPAVAGSMQAAVGFTTRDAGALAKYLAAHDVAMEQPLRDGEFAVRDPEGNLVVFVQSTAAGDVGAAGSVAKMVAATALSPSAVSRRMIHVGFAVHDRAKEEAFWCGLLGFRPYWSGGPHADQPPEWVSLQVPDGTDWVEYMMHESAHPTAKELGGNDHLSFGVDRLQELLVQLQSNGCDHATCTSIGVGMDGKMLMNVRDPDQTRVEFMEFKPTLRPCCTAFGGAQPTESENK